MKNTKKNLVKLSDLRFTVFQVKEDGSRGTQYGGLSGINLVEQLFKYASSGNRVIIVECDKAYDFLRKEYNGTMGKGSQTDTEFYNKMLKYSVNLNEFIED